MVSAAARFNFIWSYESNYKWMSNAGLTSTIWTSLLVFPQVLNLAVTHARGAIRASGRHAPVDSTTLASRRARALRRHEAAWGTSAGIDKFLTLIERR